MKFILDKHNELEGKHLSFWSRDHGKYVHISGTLPQAFMSSYPYESVIRLNKGDYYSYKHRFSSP